MNRLGRSHTRKSTNALTRPSRLVSWVVPAAILCGCSSVVGADGPSDDKGMPSIQSTPDALGRAASPAGQTGRGGPSGNQDAHCKPDAGHHPGRGGGGGHAGLGGNTSGASGIASNSGGNASNLGGGGVGAGGPPAADAGAEMCPEIEHEYWALLNRFVSCTEQVGCKLTTTPSVDAPPFCKGVSVSSASDESEIAALAARWVALGCTGGYLNCLAAPQNAIAKCIDNQCVYLTACDLCPTDLDPVCTTSGSNAINECFAEHCLGSTVASRGLCPDTPACLMMGGTCRERLPGTPPTTPPCPDGEKTGDDFLRPICAGGNFSTSCCVPWGPPCPYLAQTLNLSLDPFTCGPSTYPGRNTCMNPRGDVTSCEATWNQFLPGGGDDPDATLQVSVAPGGQVNVTGVHRGTGRTFTCTGAVWWDPFASGGSSWSCEACLGTDCTSCTIVQSTPCAM